MPSMVPVLSFWPNSSFHYQYQSVGAYSSCHRMSLKVQCSVRFSSLHTDISDTFSAHNLPYHFFADDTQMYDHCLISNIPIGLLVDNFTAVSTTYKSLLLQPSATQPHKDWVHLVWHLYDPIQDSCSIPITPGEIICYSELWDCSWPTSVVWLGTVHEDAY